ncbi:major pollen allergen Ole e 10 [Oryza sativa Japonica Group]|nr:major pollen allergen Ole e 10-like [Oryza sativa Japonica Group]
MKFIVPLMVIIIKRYILLALILSIQCGGANGTSREYSPLPPFKDVVGPSTPVAADDVPPPPYCVYPPPPTKPALPAPLPPTPASPGDSPPSIAPAGNPPTPAQAGAPPPSIAPGTGSPPPATTTPPAPGAREAGVWCVANPTVASAVAQTAMDYACASGADCDMVAAPGAPCFLPDTLMAHASYAFNSYWQRTKVAGGTCDFAGAAMLITKDPSYDGCRYVYM